MTTRDNTSPAGSFRTAHDIQHCPQRLTESFWMPSYCPVGLAEVANRLDVLTDASEVSWAGGRYATAHYRCDCCGHRWSENDWPAVFLHGPNWRHHDPGRWVAGIDAPRRTAEQDELRRRRWAAQRSAVA